MIKKLVFVVLVLLVGFALVKDVTGHSKARKERVEVQAQLDSVRAAMSLLESRTATVDTVWRERLARGKVQVDLSRAVTDTALSDLAVSGYNPAAITAAVGKERIASDRLLVDAVERGDTLASIVSDYHARLVDAISLTTRALDIPSVSEFRITATAGLNVKGEFDVVVGVGYTIPLPRLPFIN